MQALTAKPENRVPSARNAEQLLSGVNQKPETTSPCESFSPLLKHLIAICGLRILNCKY